MNDLKNALFFRYLHLSGDTFGRPINGQSEVSAYANTEPGNEWRAMVSVTKINLKQNNG